MNIMNMETLSKCLDKLIRKRSGCCPLSIDGRWNTTQHLALASKCNTHTWINSRHGHDMGQRADCVPQREEKQGVRYDTVTDLRPFSYSVTQGRFIQLSDSRCTSRKNTQNLQSVTQSCEGTTKGWLQFHIHHLHQTRDLIARLHTVASLIQSLPHNHKCFKKDFYEAECREVSLCLSGCSAAQ